MGGIDYYREVFKGYVGENSKMVALVLRNANERFLVETTAGTITDVIEESEGIKRCLLVYREAGAVTTINIPIGGYFDYKGKKCSLEKAYSHGENKELYNTIK